MKKLLENGSMVGTNLVFDTNEYYQAVSTADGLSYTAGAINHNNSPGATSASQTVDTTGLEASDMLVISFMMEASMPASTWVTGVTVNGNAATIAEYAPVDDTVKSGTGVMTQVVIAYITGESGDTATVVVDYVNGGTQYRCSTVGYVLKGSNLAVQDTDIYVSGSSGVGTLTTNVTKDCIVIYAIGLGDESDSVTLDADMVDTYNEPHPENNAKMAGGVIVPTSTANSYTADMNITNGSGEATVVAVSFSGQQTTLVDQNKKNSGVWGLDAIYDSLKPDSFVPFYETIELGAPTQSWTASASSLATNTSGTQDMTWAFEFPSGISASDSGVLAEVGGASVGMKIAIESDDNKLYIAYGGGVFSFDLSTYYGITGTLYVSIDYGTTCDVYFVKSNLNLLTIGNIAPFNTDYAGSNTMGILMNSDNIGGVQDTGTTHSNTAFSGNCSEVRQWIDKYREGVQRAVVCTFAGQTKQDGSNTSWTFANHTIGEYATEKIVVVGIHYNAWANIGAGQYKPTSVTIAGVSATILHDDAAVGYESCSMAYATITGATTGDITITFSDNIGEGVSISVFEVRGASGFVEVDYDARLNNSGGYSTTVSTQIDDVVISSYSGGNTSVTMPEAAHSNVSIRDDNHVSGNKYATGTSTVTSFSGHNYGKLMTAVFR